MRASAVLRYVRVSPQKARLVIDQIRGLPVARALEILRFSTKRAARPIMKTLESAIANAEHNEGADIDELKIERAVVDEGSRLKRYRARAKGRAGRILKRTSHIAITVGDRRSKD